MVNVAYYKITVNGTCSNVFILHRNNFSEFEILIVFI